jgi:hypothetical protein
LAEQLQTTHAPEPFSGGQRMAAPGCHDWRQLAEAARDEQDPEKLMQLIEELNRQLERRMQRLYPESSEAEG